MNQFKKINSLTGWMVFAIAATTYLLTIEPTSSWWDCGEFIASAYKLEVGHPPGAPFFMMIARIFALFAFGNVENVAMMINSMSALSSAFTILFLFWSITLLVSKYFYEKYRVDKNALSSSQLIVTMGSGVVGALAYTFSDSFWFSAVEGEVYAMSSLFTAIVFWAMLKWESVAHEKGSSRWIVLIAYLMGLSIGVHLLSLLAIPALVLIFYFKKYKYSHKGFVFSLLIGIVILATIQYGVIQGIISWAAKFELFFVNSLGLSYWSGAMFYFILLFAVLLYGIYYSHKHYKAILNMALVSLTVILIGYSSFALIVIRSQANPPLDENNPEQLYSLLSYLNREQYGDRPLIFGQYYNAPVVDQKDKYTYIPENEKYKRAKQTNPKYIYDNGYKTFLPRMYSSQGSHKSGYRNWAMIGKAQDVSPNFIDNLTYAVRYQVNFMYLRYFMWNFVGRQNDNQGHGGLTKGNWISGFKFTDGLRLGNQNYLPDEAKNAPSRNTYFMLPLILGLLGFFFYSFTAKQDNWLVILLFLFTGLAIVFYVNQPPYQPRERDYSYVGSFYAFSIWIGLSVLSVYESFKHKIPQKILAIGLSVLFTGLVPGVMAAQNWDDHDRSNRYSVRDLAANYLNSCAPNAILFTYGDNDTFPLWYVQEVEGIRTDVRVVNLSLLSTDWYVEQMQKKAYLSDPVPFSLQYNQYVNGTRDYIPVYENKAVVNEMLFESSVVKSDEDYSVLVNDLVDLLEKSDFAKLYPADLASIKQQASNFNPSTYAALLKGLNRPENIQKTNLNVEVLNTLEARVSLFNENMSNNHVQVSEVMKFVGNNDQSTRIQTQASEWLDYIPTKKFKIKVDKEKVLANGIVPQEDKDKIVDEIVWEMPNRYLLKNLLMVLDLVGNANWERPIYFALSIGDENYLGLGDYLRHEGFAYRLVPIKYTSENGEMASVNTNLLYNRIMNQFKWGNISSPDFYIDEQNSRTLRILNPREIFNRLTKELIAENKKDSAIAVLDQLNKVLPHEQIAYNYSSLPTVEHYYTLGESKKADDMLIKLSQRYGQWMRYYLSLSPDFSTIVDVDKMLAVMRMYEIANANSKGILGAELGLDAQVAMEKHFSYLQRFSSGDELAFGQAYENMSQSQRRTTAIYMQLMDYVSQSAKE